MKKYKFIIRSGSGQIYVIVEGSNSTQARKIAEATYGKDNVKILVGEAH